MYKTITRLAVLELLLSTYFFIYLFYRQIILILFLNIIVTYSWRQQWIREWEYKNKLPFWILKYNVLFFVLDFDVISLQNEQINEVTKCISTQLKYILIRWYTNITQMEKNEVIFN